MNDEEQGEPILDLFVLCREKRNAELLKELQRGKQLEKRFRECDFRQKWTVLHEACDRNNSQALHWMLIYGGDPNVPSQLGQTPLHVACAKGRSLCARLLLRHNANIHVKDSVGHTPKDKIKGGFLQRAERKEEAAILSRLLSSRELISLVEKSAEGLKKALESIKLTDIEAADLESALNVAALKGDLKSVSFLLCKGVKKLACAVELSAQMEHYDVTALLVLCQAALDGNVELLLSMFSTMGGGSSCKESLKEKILMSIEKKPPPLEVIIKVAVNANQNDIIHHLLQKMKCDASQGVVSWTHLHLHEICSKWLGDVSSWVRYFDLSDNCLVTLPSNVFSIPELVRLDLASNRLKQVPIQLFQLPNICYLNLSSNWLTHLPGESSWNGRLQKLFLSRNKLADLPDIIQTVPLELLKLDHNCFGEIPQCISCLSSLKSLDISHNPRIACLPWSLGQLTGLDHLALEGLYVNNVPHKARKSTKDIIQYLRAKLRSSKESYHVKAIVLGPPSKAKSLLVSRLTGDASVGQRRGESMPPSQLTITEWIHNPRLWAKKVFFSIWDFSGHEEYYTTHFCFLTPHSLCLVVFNLNKLSSDTSELSTWLDSIAAHAPDSVVVFIGHNLEGLAEAMLEDKYLARVRSRIRQKLQEPSYRSLTFGGVCAVQDDSESKNSMQKLRGTLYQAAMNLFDKHKEAVRRMVPASYLQLAKKVLQQRHNLAHLNQCPILTRNELFQLVSDLPGNDIDTPAECDLAIHFLRQTGIILHYNIPCAKLSSLVFVDPSWLFGIMGRVIRSRGSNDGLLTKSNISYLFPINRFPTEYHPSVFRLLNQFAIAVIIDEQLFLVPSLLPSHSALSYPDVEYEYQRDYQFAHVPSTFWSRLLARLVLAVNDIATALSGKDQLLFSLRQGGSLLERTSLDSVDSSGYVHVEWSENKAAVPAVALHAPRRSSRHNERNLVSMIGTEMDWFSGQKGKTNEIGKDEVGNRVEEESAGLPESLRSENGREGSVFSSNASDQPNTQFGYTRYSVTYQCQDTHFRVVGNAGEERHSGKVMSIMTSCNSNGRKAMAMLADVVRSLVREWYPQLLSNHNDVFVQQTIRCLQCLRSAVETVNNFSIEACAEAALTGDLIACHQHINDDTELKELVPEFFFVDLPKSSILSIVDFDVEEKPIGRGADAEVFQAVYEDDLVAYKKYDHFPGSPIREFGRLRTEVAFLHRLDHPNIIKMIGVCLHPLALVLEWACHGHLQQHLSQSRVRLPRLFLYNCSHQIASALSYLHSKLIVFRGLSPAKVLVTSFALSDDVNVKLADFGKAGVESPSGLRGDEGYNCYKAPEISRYDGEEEYNSPVDVFSFAMLLYEIVTGRVPFSAEGTSNSCSLIAQKLRPKLNDWSVPEGGMYYMSELMQLCWHDNPERRPKARQVASHLVIPQCQAVLGYQSLASSAGIRVVLPVVEEKEIWVFTDNEEETVRAYVLDAVTLAVKADLGNLTCSPQCAAVVGGSTVWIGDVREKSILIFDAQQKKIVDVYHAEAAVLCLAVSGLTVFAGLANGTLTVYQDTELFRPKTIVVGREPLLSLVAVGKEVWCCCEKDLYVYGVNELDLIVKCQSEDTVTGLVVSPDQKTVWTMHRKLALLSQWDVATHTLVYSFDCFQPSATLFHPRKRSRGSGRRPTATPFSFAGDKVYTVLPVLDTLWVGTKNGYILVFSASDASHLTQFGPHVEKTRCLVELGLPGPAGTEEAVVISGGSGFNADPLEGTDDNVLQVSTGSKGVVLLWEAVPAEDIKIMETKLLKHQDVSY